MKVGIIGAGLGGLLSGAYLSEKGFDVEIFEKLPFAGGRFTSINYRGYEVSTGALHMIPHGRRGPLGKLLREIGCRVEIVDSKPEGEIFWDGEREPLSRKCFPWKDYAKFNMELILTKLKLRSKNLENFGEKLDRKTYFFMKSFLGWSFSIFPEHMNFKKVVPVYHNLAKYRGPGIPVGGCRAVTDGLVEVIQSNDGCVFLRKEVKALKPGKNPELVFNGDSRKFDIILSDIGHRLTGKLIGEDAVNHPPESRGVKYTISLDEPFVGHTGVLFVLGKSIAGMNEVTNADENLGRKHMLQIHQPLREGSREEILQGLREIKEILKGCSYEIIAVQSYRGDWPVNRIMAGMDIGNRTKYDNIYVVGDGAKGDDIEVDGVAIGVKRVVEEIV